MYETNETQFFLPPVYSEYYIHFLFLSFLFYFASLSLFCLQPLKRKYLKCSSYATVGHIKKFISGKLKLESCRDVSNYYHLSFIVSLKGQGHVM